MLRENVAGSPIVDADEVARTAVGVGGQVPIQQDHGDLSTSEGFDDLAVDRVLLAGVLERSEKHPRNPSRDELVAQRLYFLRRGPRFRWRFAPQQRMVFLFSRFGQSQAHGFKDLRLPQVGDE